MFKRLLPYRPTRNSNINLYECLVSLSVCKLFGVHAGVMVQSEHDDVQNSKSLNVIWNRFKNMAWDMYAIIIDLLASLVLIN